MKKYSKEHEWVELNQNTAIIGITDYAQKQLGDVVYVSLVKNISDPILQNDTVAEIESVKSVSPVYSPVSGKLIEFNTLFEDESKSVLINQDPYGEGWIFKIEIDSPSQFDELMSEEEYNNFISTL